MNIDKSLSISDRLAINLEYFFAQITAKDEKEIMNQILDKFDTVLTEILKHKMGFSVSQNDDFKLPFATKVDLLASKGIIGADLKRILSIFDILNKNISEDDTHFLESEDNKKLISELVDFCDNPLFKFLNKENELKNTIGKKEGLIFIYAVIAAALVESLVA